ESRKGVELPNLRAASLQVQLPLSFLRYHRCGCFRCHNPYPTPNLKKSAYFDPALETATASLRCLQ
ncbi:MAG: hypothetical protein M3N42_18650, partial [Cyanobacteriota bacterium]|nr:hypothetical protein [Cyanobacteriota bacterium]